VRVFLFIMSLALTILMLTGICAGKETVIVWGGPWSGVSDIISEFNDIQNEIEIVCEPITPGGGDPNGKLTAAVIAGSPPNLVLTWNDDIISWALEQLIMPIDEFYLRTDLQEDDYAKGAWEQTHYRGHVYGVPVDWDPDSVFYHNTRLFAEAGLPLDAVPQYLDDMEAVHKKLIRVDSDGRYIQIGIKPLEGWQFNGLYLTKAFGGEVWSLEKNRPNIDNPRNRAAMQWLADWSLRYSHMETELGGGFTNEKTAMMIGGDWMLSYMPDVDFGITRAPYPREGIPFFPGSGWSWVVPAGVSNLDATYEVLKWLVTKDITLRLTDAIGWLPANIRYRESDEMQDYPMGVFSSIAAAEGEFIWMNPNPIMSKLGQLFYHEVTMKVWHQEAVPQQALANAQRKAEALYVEFADRHGLPVE